MRVLRFRWSEPGSPRQSFTPVLSSVLTSIAATSAKLSIAPGRKALSWTSEGSVCELSAPPPSSLQILISLLALIYMSAMASSPVDSSLLPWTVMLTGQLPPSQDCRLGLPGNRCPAYLPSFLVAYRAHLSQWLASPSELDEEASHMYSNQVTKIPCHTFHSVRKILPREAVSIV